MRIWDLLSRNNSPNLLICKEMSYTPRMPSFMQRPFSSQEGLSKPANCQNDELYILDNNVFWQVGEKFVRNCRKNKYYTEGSECDLTVQRVRRVSNQCNVCKVSEKNSGLDGTQRIIRQLVQSRFWIFSSTWVNAHRTNPCNRVPPTQLLWWALQQ